MKKKLSQQKSAHSHANRTPQQRQRLVVLWIFTVFLVMTVSLVVYGLWVSVN